MPKSKRDRDPKFRRIVVHGLRVAIFVSILWMIRQAHSKLPVVESSLESSESAVQFALESIEVGKSVQPASNESGLHAILDAEGKTVGSLLQTSPQSDHIIGYSGPTNCLVVLDSEDRIQAIRIASSGDTVEHVAAVNAAPDFADAFVGIQFGDSQPWQEIDAVSGATLTSYAIVSSISNRMGANAPSLKFSARPSIEKVRSLYENASRIEPSKQKNIWNVMFHAEKVGSVVSTSPHADHLSGYQGPTATLLGFDLDNKCVGMIVDQTYENDPYATYLDDDHYFQSLYISKTLEEISKMDPEAEGIDGVSGATMTSVCVADGVFLSAKRTIDSSNSSVSFTRTLSSFWADIVTAVLTIVGVLFSFGYFRKNKYIRITYLIAVIAFLGFINGHMLSQASIAGWARTGIPWSVAPGLVLLSVAALIVPIVSKHQPYCHHICPFGAMQQLAKKRSPWQIKIPKRIDRVLRWIPFLLVALVVVVAMSSLSFNLASIEPFDGFAFRVAGWATITIFVVGLVSSIVSPMAYCRFGCPTGALLGFLKFRADSHRLGLRDWAAGLLLAIAILIHFM